jgi:hypothetical protein
MNFNNTALDIFCGTTCLKVRGDAVAVVDVCYGQP